jgi:hypothetical protein
MSKPCVKESYVSGTLSHFLLHLPITEEHNTEETLPYTDSPLILRIKAILTCK